MTTAMLPEHRVPRRRTSLVAPTAARAVVAAVLAAVITFSTNHDRPAFGLIVLGVFAIALGAVTAFGVRALPAFRAARALVLTRAAVLVVGGVVALTLLQGGLIALVTVQAGIFLLAGALELVAGLRRDGVPEVRGDAVVVGGLQVLVGVLLVVLDRDAVFTVGVLGAWGAVVAVYLGIAAVSLRRQAARP